MNGGGQVGYPHTPEKKGTPVPGQEPRELGLGAGQGRPWPEAAGVPGE